MMKDGVVIVNTARGPAWNLDAVYEGIKVRKGGAAGVDVYEQEPPEPDMPILSCPTWYSSPILPLRPGIQAGGQHGQRSVRHRRPGGKDSENCPERIRRRRWIFI